MGQIIECFWKDNRLFYIWIAKFYNQPLPIDKAKYFSCNTIDILMFTPVIIKMMTNYYIYKYIQIRLLNKNLSTQTFAIK